MKEQLITVRLPNGKVMRDVPISTPKWEVLRRAIKAGIYTPDDAPEQPYSPTDPDRIVENTLAGIGRGMHGKWLGTQQALDEVTGIGDGAELQAAIDERKIRDKPLTDTTAGAVGDFIGSTVPDLLIPGGAQYKTAAAIGGATGFLDPVASDESRIWNTVLAGGGGALGKGVADFAGRAIQPIKEKVSEATQRLLQRATAEGIPTSAADKTGSRFLRVLDSVIDNYPIAGGRNVKAKEAQREAWTAALFRKIGLDDTTKAIDASASTLNAAHKKLGDDYDELLGKYDIDVETEGALNKLIEIEEKINKFTPSSSKQPFEIALDMFDNAKKISGLELQRINSTIRKRIKAAKVRGDANEREILGGVQDLLRQLYADVASPEDVARLARTDARYSMLKSVEKATSNGQVSPKKLFNILEREFSDIMKRGAGDQDFADLARIGKEFVAETVPDSGTAQRTMVQNVLGGGASAGTAAAAVVNPLLGLKLAALASMPIAAQRAVRGPSQKFFTEGLLRNRPLVSSLPNLTNVRRMGSLLAPRAGGELGARAAEIGVPDIMPAFQSLLASEE